MKPSDLGARPLLIAPHPDDEVLSAGGTLAMAARGGADVRIAFLTDGDGYLRGAARLRGHYVPLACRPIGDLKPEDYRRLGDVRVRESRASIAALGLDEGSPVFLGFPDGVLHELASTDDVVQGPAGRPTARASAMGTGPACTRTELVGALSEIVARHDPTAVLLPHAADNNPDHRAGAELGARALADAEYRGPAYAYLVHHYTWPWSRPTGGLRPPRALARAGAWERVELDADSRAAKSAAVEAHASQLAVPDLGFFMRSFVRRDEWLEVLGGGLAEG